MRRPCRVIKQMIESYNYFRADIFQAFVQTLDMMATAMALSLLMGLLLGFLLFMTRPEGLYQNRIFYFFLSGGINIIRSVPFILFIIVMIPFNRLLLGTGFGVDASKIPLSLIGMATFARFTERDLLDIDKSLYETAYALGATSLQYCLYFLLKEGRPGLILSFTSTTISLLSYSTVMGIIGGGGLGYLAISEGYYNFNYALMWIIIMMVILVQIIQTTGNILAKKNDIR